MKIVRCLKTFLFILFLFFFVMLFFNEKVYADSYENSTLNVSVYVKEPIARVQINPSNIYLGEITKGYATNSTNITFTNNGDLKIKIMPVLSSGANPLFNNLEFNTGTCTPSATWYNMSSWSGLTIDKPSEFGGTRSDYVCIRLNLKNYDGAVSGNTNLTTQLTIWVMPS
ncbi:MAG: hypothetical protein KatS3mg093_349 [Candidatus Parcubacteria bacterium]|nr:MAG: hypothetical protein KatS3mg001_313 [Candidatus Pacearchaeota archaeon]GIW65370.1 MAG: hypothetical protein KatS3mg093_349 [Candidatus Parcubacteria bacterium]